MIIDTRKFDTEIENRSLDGIQYFSHIYNT